MHPSSSTGNTSLDQERQRFQQQIADLDITQDDDPLDIYYQYAQWLDHNYSPEHAVDSGLVDLLEEATKAFLKDNHYKSDLRYLKLWVLYAKHVEDPGSVYSHLLSKSIGTGYALLYEEYADLLEKIENLSQADELYRRGIHRRARPADRLKAKYQQFQERNPIKDAHNPGHNRYAPMLARPAPGKRPEKLRLDMSLIFTKEGIEYSIQEARARSMGLLGKKWPPPAPTDLDLERTSKVRVNFSDDGTKNLRPGRKSLLASAEPTVTLATKEALADVFGMYNSPEKSMRYGIIPGSKHAPVHTVKIIPKQPFSHSHIRELSNENSNAPPKGQTFTPFVDEKLRQDPKPTPARFQPYVDPDLQNNVPPANVRKALATKETVPPSPPILDISDENAGVPLRPSSSRPIPPSSSGENNNKSGTVFSKVFTPAPSHAEESQKPQPFRPFVGPKATTFTPLRDPKQPSSFKVFSRPTAQDENKQMSRSTFKPYMDPGSRFENRNSRLVSSSQGVLSANKHFDDDAEEDEEDDQSLGTPESKFDGEIREDLIEVKTPGAESTDDNTGSYRGRFGRADIDIMTPIAERTFEVTTTSTLPVAPSFKIQDATIAAMQLAAELREEDEQEGTQELLRYDPVYSPDYPDDDEDEFEEEGRFTTDNRLDQNLEARTGALSLIEAMTVASSFKPPNPCVPFEPSITSTLLSLTPPNFGLHDHMHEDANQLALLQKFCKKQERRESNTSSHISDEFPLTLGGRQYDVVGKLGEGGFGAVFAAKDVALTDDDADADIDAMVAIKVVRPQNLWELCVLQNLRTSLPADLRSSIIEPHALFAFRDESFLILDMCSQGTLLELVNRVHEINIGQKGACLDELLVVFFTIELLRLVEAMHAQGFIHGDLKIDNCLLRLEAVPGGSSAWSSAYQPSRTGGWSYKGIKLIDFGRTIDTRQFPKGQQFIADWPTDARDCKEMRSGAPWTYQPDYFGLAGIVYCMLYGKYFDEHSVVMCAGGGTTTTAPRYKLSVSFKRYWQVDLWTELFELLLNPTLARPDGQLPLCTELGSIRVKFEGWLQRNDRGISASLQGLLKKVTIATERG